MAFVITEKCVGTADGACVEVCPVDCIHPDPETVDKSTDQLYINPTECIDCGACEPVCPVSAIFEEDAVPEEYHNSIQENADYYEG